MIHRLTFIKDMFIYKINIFESKLFMNELMILSSCELLRTKISKLY